MHNRIPDPVKCKIQRMTYEIKEIQEKLGIKHEMPQDSCDD